jgi:hypothetical protein
LLAVGCSDAKNSAFIEFVAVFGDEYHGKYGTLADIAMDMSDLKRSTASVLWDKEGVPRHFIPLTSLESEAYFLYNINEDSVVLIEDGSTPKLLAGNHDHHWPTFNEFLTDFFEL